jgi:putative transposase
MLSSVVSGFSRTHQAWNAACQMCSMRTGSPGHLRAFDYVGLHQYFLTFCTDRRQKLFTESAIVDLVLSQISRAAGENHFDAIAYCFMPDHLHLLVEAVSENSDCKRFIARAKQYSGFDYADARQARLWQRYGYEHVLRDEEMMLVVAKYVLENPIRAGLVKQVEDYPFVGSLKCSLADLLVAIATRSG